MTALPNMPTREEVEETVRQCDLFKKVHGLKWPQLTPFYYIHELLDAARAYLTLDAEIKRLQHKLEASEEHRAQLLKDPNTLAKEAWELVKADYVSRSEFNRELLAAELQVARLRESLSALCGFISNDGPHVSYYKQDSSPYVAWQLLQSTPPTDVLERVRKMAAALEWIGDLKGYGGAGEAYRLLSEAGSRAREALEQAKEMGLV